LAGGGVTGGRGITHRTFRLKGFAKRCATGAFFLFVIEYLITWITPDLHNYLPNNYDHSHKKESYDSFLNRISRSHEEDEDEGKDK